MNYLVWFVVRFVVDLWFVWLLVVALRCVCVLIVCVAGVGLGVAVVWWDVVDVWVLG